LHIFERTAPQQIWAARTRQLLFSLSLLFLAFLAPPSAVLPPPTTTAAELLASLAAPSIVHSQQQQQTQAEKEAAGVVENVGCSS
jgi:hypothetical protein